MMCLHLATQVFKRLTFIDVVKATEAGRERQCCPAWELGRKTQALLPNRWQQYSSYTA